MAQKRQNTNSNLQATIHNGIAALSLLLKEYLKKGIEMERNVKVAMILVKSGACTQNPIFEEIAQLCSLQQKADGGWIGVEDSFWSVAFLKEFPGYFHEYKHGLDWLKAQKLENAA